LSTVDDVSHRASNPDQREVAVNQALAYNAALRVLRQRHADEFNWIYGEQKKLQALKATKAMRSD
jgi:hypothetical protein